MVCAVLIYFRKIIISSQKFPWELSPTVGIVGGLALGPPILYAHVFDSQVEGLNISNSRLTSVFILGLSSSPDSILIHACDDKY